MASNITIYGYKIFYKLNKSSKNFVLLVKKDDKRIIACFYNKR